MAKEQTVISHWNELIEGFEASPLAFYEQLDAAMTKRQVPDTERIRIEFKEGGLMSANREYLRITRGRHAFDVCAAPFGTGFFFSWWLTELPSAHGLLYLAAFTFGMFCFLGIAFKLGFVMGLFMMFFILPLLLWGIGNMIREGNLGSEDIVLAIPLIGSLYARIFQPPTYYKIDTALMFQAAVHKAVVEVINQMTAAKGLRALSESESKPIMKRFAQHA